MDKICEEYVIKQGDNQKISKMKNILDDFLVVKELDGLASSFQNDIRYRNTSYINWKKANQEHREKSEEDDRDNNVGWSINVIKSRYEEAFEVGYPFFMMPRQFEDLKRLFE